MSRLKVTFNGVVITDFLTVTSLDRGVGTDNTNNLEKIGLSDGKYLTSRTYEEKIIPMGFALIGDVAKISRALAGALNTKEPAKLIFSDEPDKYYLAVPDGDIPLRDIIKLGEGTINWLVPEGVAYSLKETEVLDTNGIFTLDYKGTAQTWPRFEIENPTTNGFIALINQDGKVVQLGEPEETDLEPYQKSERAIKEPFNADSGKWTANAGITTYPYFLSDKSIPNPIEGSYNWAKIATTIIPVFKANSIRRWSMPSLNRVIPPTSEGKRNGNFQTKTRVHFYQRNVNERGRIEKVIQSDNNVLAAIILRDSSTSTKNLMFDCYALGKRLGYFSLDPKKYFGGFYELDITKIANNFAFKISIVADLSGKAPVLKDSFQKAWTLLDYKNQSATSVTLLTGKFHDKPVNEMHFADFVFDWINVDKLADVPNSFNEGDFVVVDHSDGTVTLNDVKNNNLGVPGNEFFTLSPGKNDIQLVWSDWAEKPTVKIVYQERWK